MPYFLCTAGAGAAIAPPPSLTESSDPSSGQDNEEASSKKAANKAKGLGVAAKIMAKYGYKVSNVTYAACLEFSLKKFGIAKIFNTMLQIFAN